MVSMRRQNKIYVGMRPTTHEYEVFRSEINPTEQTHGDKYVLVIGEFRTVRGANFMAKYGRNNPHIWHVNDAERIAKQYARQDS